MSGGGAGVWPFLRCARDYREAWRAHAGPPQYEDAPFPVRIQSEADLEAVRSWRMEEQGFVWPTIRDGAMTLNHAQFEALFAGLDWRRVRALSVRAPAEAE